MTKNEIRKKDNKERYKDGCIIPLQRKDTYMRTSRVKKLFRTWLKENLHRFNYKPYARNGMCEEYYFEGIIKSITLVMDYGYPEAMIFHENPMHSDGCCDHDVVEYIGQEKYDPEKGYYDADRVDGIYDYFPTQEALYTHNVFEKIIKYVNEKFVEENALYIDESVRSSSSKIAPKADSEKLKERFTGTGFCMEVGCTADGLESVREDDEPVLYQFELFREKKS